MHDQVTGQGLRDLAGTVVVDEDASDVYCWRMERLLDAGYSHLVADILARETDIDLHAACDLLARGCEERTAYRILL